MKRREKAAPDIIAASDLRTLPQLQQELAVLFPTMLSLRWHLRINGDRYVRAEAIFRSGRRMLAHRQRFEQIALRIAAEKAKA